MWSCERVQQKLGYQFYVAPADVFRVMEQSPASERRVCAGNSFGAFELSALPPLSGYCANYVRVQLNRFLLCL